MKARLRAGDPRARRALRDLVVQADAWLGQGPAATGAEPWPHPELHFHAHTASDVVHASHVVPAATAGHGDRRAGAALADLAAPPGGDLWALRPAPEQLDGVTG